MVGANTNMVDDSYLRKMRKPMVEKKRRDRMNVSIDHLKALMAKSSKNPSSVVKMDKAEILELAVIHLTQLQERPKTSSSVRMSSYRAGFRACTKETARYLKSSVLMPNLLTLELDNHLNNFCKTSHHKSLDISSATLLPERHCTSSPVLDSMPPMPPMQRFSPFYGNTMFSPISSVDMRGHVMHSPLNTVLFNSVSRSSSPCSAPSPALSTCSSSASESSAFGLSVNCMDTGSDLDTSNQIDSKSNIVLDHVIKEEKPWRPW